MTRLKRLLYKRCISQKDFAASCSMSEGMLSMILSGKRNPTPHIRARICSALGVQVEKLFPYKAKK